MCIVPEMRFVDLLLLIILVIVNALFIRSAQQDIITAIAGTGTAGYSGDGGAATSAAMNYPCGIAVDSLG